MLMPSMTSFYFNFQLANDEYVLGNVMQRSIAHRVDQCGRVCVCVQKCVQKRRGASADLHLWIWIVNKILRLESNTSLHQYIEPQTIINTLDY